MSIITNKFIFEWVGQNWSQIIIVICLLFIACTVFNIRKEIKRYHNVEKD